MSRHLFGELRSDNHKERRRVFTLPQPLQPPARSCSPPPIHVVAQPDGSATYSLWNPGGEDVPLPQLTADMERIRAEYIERTPDHYSHSQEPSHAV